MEYVAWTWWLRSSETTAKRITPAGLLLGRSAHCDFILRSEQASRRHALVYLDSDGPRLVPLGRIAPTVGGTATDGVVELKVGDKVELLDLSLEVARDQSSAPGLPAGGAVWVLEGPGGGLYGMSTSPFLVGGSDDDDLHIEGWPHAALSFRIRTDGRLEVEPREPVVVDDAPLEAGAVKRVKPGDRLTLNDATVRIVTGGDLMSGTTATLEARSGGVEAVRLEFLPRGARLHLTIAREVHSVYLTDRRSDLVAVLLQPPDGNAPGDFLEDDIVLSRVWGKKRADRTNLNVLLHRVRKDLTRIGLDGGKIFERSEGGLATRFVLENDATVELE